MEVKVKTFQGLKKGSGSHDQLDLEEVKEKKQFVNSMVQSRQIQQQKFLSKIKAQFNPLRILQLDRKSVLAGEEQKSGKKEFDTIGVWEIDRRRYTEITNPLKLGVFDSAKCYYVVFRKGNKVSIVLWRGKDQPMLSF